MALESPRGSRDYKACKTFLPAALGQGSLVLELMDEYPGVQVFGDPGFHQMSKAGASLRCLTCGDGLNESGKQAHRSQAGVLQHLQQTLALQRRPLDKVVLSQL